MIAFFKSSIDFDESEQWIKHVILNHLGWNLFFFFFVSQFPQQQQTINDDNDSFRAYHLYIFY